MPERASADVLGAVRAATASRHRRLDQAMPLALPGAGLADYRDHLRLLRAWLAPLEEWLSRFDDGPQAPAHRQRSRTALLDADLAKLALAAGAGAPFPEPAGPAALEPGAAFRWGVCYVIEGSQLGGALLAHRFGALLTQHGLHGLRYLQGGADGHVVGSGPAPGWKAFIAAMRANVAAPGEVAQACAGACAAFDGILALQDDFVRHKNLQPG